MELRHLRYFVAVAEDLNFTRAARRLHLAQPSLTRQIHNLEEELGVRLLNRTKNRVSLTEEGSSFLEDAKRLVTLSLESVRAVQQRGRGDTTQLNIGYLSHFNFDSLPATLAALRHTCPEVAVNLFDMPPADQLRALEAQKIDLGFVGLRPPVADKNLASLDWERVARHRVVVVLPAHHALAKQAKVKLEDLKTLFFVAISEKTHPGSRDWLCRLCQEVGYTPRVLQDVELEAGLMTFVAEGLGVTLAREQIRRLPHPGVVFRPLAVPTAADYWIAWHRENRSKALQQYLGIVRSHVGSLR